MITNIWVVWNRAIIWIYLRWRHYVNMFGCCYFMRPYMPSLITHHRPLRQSHALWINRRTSQPATDHLDHSQTIQLGQVSQTRQTSRTSPRQSEHCQFCNGAYTRNSIQLDQPVLAYVGACNFRISRMHYSSHLRRFPRAKLNDQLCLSSCHPRETHGHSYLQTNRPQTDAHTYGQIAD